MIAFAAVTACSASVPGLVGDRMVLPHSLHEVSAIVAVDATTLACVQDEKGALFFVDLEGKRPVRSTVFGVPGDYEGLALVGEQFWVLRSDGTVLRLVARGERLEIDGTVQLPRGFGEWESLCYDADRRLLLAMPKGEGAPDGGRRERPIFAIDPRDGSLRADPVLVLDANALEQAVAAKDVELSGKGKPKGKRGKLHFVVSEMLAVPATGDLLILSVRDHALLRVGHDGALRSVRALDPEVLPQAEGLALLRDGRLLVASEGDDHGTIQVVPMP